MYKWNQFGENVKVVVTRTPLDTIFGLGGIAISKILSEKQSRETGKMASLAIAPEGGMTSREGEPLPEELRKKMLRNMAEK
jgi:hypothetical protein